MDPLTMALIGMGVQGGSAILGSVLGGTKSKPQTFQEPFPGYNADVQNVLGTAQSKMNTPAPTYSGTFDLNPSDIENATTSSILGKIRNPVQPQTFSSDITDKYYNAHKARVNADYDVQRKQSADMYNKLGLLTSTPQMQAQQDINKSQELTDEDISSQLMYEDIAREQQAQQIADQINQEYLSKGMILGQQDYSNQQYTDSANYNDFARSQAVPLQYAQLAAGILGGQHPTPETTYPDTATNLANTGVDIGSLLAMYGILGQKGNTNAAGNATNSGASYSLNSSPYYTPLSLPVGT